MCKTLNQRDINVHVHASIFTIHYANTSGISNLRTSIHVKVAKSLPRRDGEIKVDLGHMYRVSQKNIPL